MKNFIAPVLATFAILLSAPDARAFTLCAPGSCGAFCEKQYPDHGPGWEECLQTCLDLKKKRCPKPRPVPAPVVMPPVQVTPPSPPIQPPAPTPAPITVIPPAEVYVIRDVIGDLLRCLHEGRPVEECLRGLGFDL